MKLYKSDIQKLVKEKKEDTFWNHLLSCFKKDYKLNGEIKINTIKVWQKNHITGLSYPVYTFEFNSKDELIKVTDQLNSFAKFLQLLFPLFFFFPLLSNAFINFEIKRFFASIIIFIFLTFVCYLVSYKIHQYETKEQLSNFYKILSFKTEEKQEKEWNKSKIITRSLIYPFCFGLIILSTFFMIPEGNFLIAILILGIVGVYLYSDLTLIFRNKKDSKK